MSLMGSAPPSCTSHNFITELWYIAPSIHHCDVQSHTPPVTAVTPPATRAAHTRSGPYTAAAAPSHHRVTTAAKHHHTPPYRSCAPSNQLDVQRCRIYQTPHHRHKTIHHLTIHHLTPPYPYMADDRPAWGQRATRNPKGPYKWSSGKNGETVVSIECGAHKGKKGVVQKCGWEISGGEDMVYLIKVTNKSNVVVWSSDTAIVVDELAQPGPLHSATIVLGQAGSGARWCMVVYGGVSLC